MVIRCVDRLTPRRFTNNRFHILDGHIFAGFRGNVGVKSGCICLCGKRVYRHKAERHHKRQQECQ